MCSSKICNKLVEIILELIGIEGPFELIENLVQNIFRALTVLWLPKKSSGLSLCYETAKT